MNKPADILEINGDGFENGFRWTGGDLLIEHKEIDGGFERLNVSFLLNKKDVEHLRNWLNQHAAK